MRSAASISQAFYMNFKDIFWKNPISVFFSNAFRIWLTVPSCYKSFILFLLCQKRLFLLKMPFSTLRKLCCSYYAEKTKIRPKNLVGRKYPVVIIMSVFYPLEILCSGAKNGRILPNLRTVFTPFCRVKNGRDFQQLIPNWLQIGHWCIS